MAERDTPPPEIEWPTADAVARAIIAAAKVLDEDPLAIAGEGWLRSRLPAVKALKVFYGDLAWDRLGRLVGLPGSTQARVVSAERTQWWPDLGDAAFDAAVTALEAL